MKNLKWFFSELIKLLSDEKSYFSKKRVESFIIFLAVLITYIWYCIVNITTMSATDFTLVSGAIMVYGGYTVNSIQKEKKMNKEI
jgi:hypothetical protein